MIVGLLPVLLILSGFAVVAAFFFMALYRVGSKKRKSPFVGAFLRGPGHTVGAQFNDALVDLLGLLMGAALFPLLVTLVPLIQAGMTGKSYGAGSLAFYGLLVLVGLAWLGVKVYRQVRVVQNLRLGHEGEVGVGQELNQLLAHGFRVYHDFPAEKFNIDHIVIGRTGVFAVETKARAKPDSGDGRKDAKLDYDGKALRFPGWVETEPVEQAVRQAAWLSKWLASAVGEAVPVTAALAVPGWFITRTKPSQVLMYNGKRPDKVFPQCPGKALDAVMIQRIAHQVEAKCRDVTPRPYTGPATRGK